MKKKNSNVLLVGVAVVALATYVVEKPVANMFVAHVSANDEEDSADDSKEEDKNDDSKKTESSQKSEEKQQESSKKAQEKQRESAKKSEEIKNESAKKAAEIKQESAKKQTEILQKSQQQKIDTSKSFNRSKDMSSQDSVSDTDVSSVENEDDDSAKTTDEVEDKNERTKHAVEKIAEAEKYILEQQSEGKDVTIALERLVQAKNMLKASDVVALDATGKNSSDDLMKEALKLTHAAQEEDVHAINDVDKFIKKAADRIDQAQEKLVKLQSVGGDVSSYQAMIDVASSDLKNAKDMILKNASLLDIAALAQQSEYEAKSAKRAIEAALLALGDDDDELSGEHKSVVAKAVEDLLYVASVEDDDAIGENIREIARAQRDSARDVNNFVDDAQSRGKFSEFVLGPKYTDLQGIQSQVSANQARIQSLLQIMPTLSDPELQDIVNEHITVLSEENTKLQGFVVGKEKQKGIFGWVFRLMQ